MSGKVYTVPSGVPFLKALAQGLLARHPVDADPFAIADVTVFLPTRRAMRGLEEAFVELQAARGQAALLMPRMRALGDGDEEEIALAEDSDAANAEIPPAVPAMHRRLRLAQILMKGPRPMHFAEALGWAKSLARFLDEVLIEEAKLERLADVVPEELARHFQSSRDFLRILTEVWPSILAEDGYIESAARRAMVMEAVASGWRRRPPKAVYIAGSTGSIPATARLMAAALSLPTGVLILPGLDRSLDESAWGEVGETHPQFGLRRLLDHLDVERRDVKDWPYTDDLPRAPPERVRILAEALRPAPTTDSWARSLAGVPLAAALADLKLAIARDQSEEGRIIALAMRQAAEHPEETAILVTPDRRLARHVCAELKRWDIRVDDSAGIPLAQTQRIILLRLLIDVVVQDFAPVPLLALLKHPLASLGYAHQSRFALVRARFERLALRGGRPPPGLRGLRKRLEERRLERESRRGPGEGSRLATWPLDSHDLLNRTEAALRPLTNLYGVGQASPAAWAVALARSAETLAGGTVWQGDEGEAAADVVHSLGALAAENELSLAEFRRLLDVATEERVVRPRMRLHPRLAILGPLEARLQSADLVILGGLNEGMWPAHADVDAWANRQMRAALGMSAPERRIGLAAHDFQELAAAPRVLMTASQKIDGSPALRSRWLMRLENFLFGRDALAHLTGEPLVDWARALDVPRAPRPERRPEPRPPVELRPRRLSITEVKALRRDPYAIYAKHILKLRPLAPVDEDDTAKKRGIVFHRIFERFCKSCPDALPVGALEVLLGIGESEMNALGLEPEASRLWSARFGRAAKALIDWESVRREGHRVLAVEASGEVVLALKSSSFTLTGRIDRIDIDRVTGVLTILDYKTGSPPSTPQVKTMLDPQLPLGGLLARKGALEGIAPHEVGAVLYLRVGGGLADIEKSAITADVDALIDKTEAGLIARLELFDDPSIAYHSWSMPQFERERGGDYDLLARVKEWRIDQGEVE